MEGESTLEHMRRLHPPPPDVAGGRLLEWAFAFDLPRRPDDVWALVSDTSRVNRALGLGEMRFDEKDGVLHGSATHLGFRQEWIEVPWAWVKGSHLTSLRRYARGMARSVWSVYRLEPTRDGEGTRFLVYFGWSPAGLLGALGIRLAMRWLERRYQDVVGRLADASLPLALPPPPPPLVPPATLERVRAIRAELERRRLDAEVVERLVAHVLSDDELDLHRLQPLDLARVLGVDEDELLRTCLHATRLGLLDLRWDVVCPHCRGVRQELGNLGDVPPRSACEVCGIDFTTDVENAIEITFRIHPSIREVPERFYCSAEPATKEHIEVQLALGPGEVRRVSTRLVPGRHRLRLRGSKTEAFLDVAERGSEATELRFVASRGPEEARSGTSPTLVLENDRDEPTTFVVERARWSDTALRPGRLLSFQDFRDLFSDQFLAADVQLEVGEQTILFTDIVGSTAFYERRGDPSAFVEVKRHFDELFSIVSKNRGAVVKTIGDATMAAFCTPLDAVRAAVRMHEVFHEERADTEIRLRISLHTGPCIAVRIHQGIDYFGGTVNVAAKLQSLAEGGDVAMSEKTFGAPGVEAFLGGCRGRLESAEYRSAALEHPIEVKRLSTFRAR